MEVETAVEAEIPAYHAILAHSVTGTGLQPRRRLHFIPLKTDVYPWRPLRGRRTTGEAFVWYTNSGEI